MQSHEKLTSDVQCVLKDFNALLCPEEIKGVDLGARGLALVNSLKYIFFIEVIKLMALPLLDRRFIGITLMGFPRKG